jgi:hypothetical protein
VRERDLFSLDPSKPKNPQILAVILQFVVILGGPALGLAAIKFYPFLVQDRTWDIGGIASILTLFLTSFLYFKDNDFPAEVPALLRLLFRMGWGLALTFLLVGVVGIANGYGTKLTNREVEVVSKHQSRERETSRRTNYLSVRAWSKSRAVVDLEVSREIYERLDVPLTPIHSPQEMLDEMPVAGHVRLVVGEGRLGLEWFKRVEQE